MPKKKQSQPRLIDATLREGFQSPSTVFTVEDVKRIATKIAEGGVDTLEVGHPYISTEVRKFTRSVVDLNLGIPVLAHARASRPDIDAVGNSGADWVGIFLGVNEISQTARLGGRSFEQLTDIIDDSVSHAKSLGLQIRFTIEDCSRTDWDRMTKAFDRAVASGADRLCLADTVGVMEPLAVSEHVARIKETYPDQDVEVHFHDDRGLAMANALAAVDAGADWISVCINGLGERCGITDHTVLAMNLHHRGTRKLSEKQALALVSATADVAVCSGQVIAQSRPVVGEYAFTHTSRLHVLAVEKDQRSYEWIDPSMVGRSHQTMPIKSRTDGQG